MSYRRELSTVLLVSALGCGGKAQAVADGGGGSASSSGGASSGASASSGSGGSSGSSDSGSDSATGSVFDAEIPDAFPATCAQFTFALNPDAAAETCAFTPADVACNANADCTPYVKVGCGCFDPVYGVNTGSTARCIPPPCVPLMNACPSSASGLYTQDCQFVPDSQNVAVACVDHRCLTYAAAAGSE